MLRRVAALLVLLQAGWVSAADTEAVAPKSSGSAVTVTRFFRQIETLEQQTERAIAANDKVKLNQLLSPVFVLQMADGSLAAKDSPGALAKLPHGNLKLVHLHEVGNVLVAYVKLDGAGDTAMTDIWQAVDGTNWQLRLRILPK
jgi:hypothetical protein